MLLVLRLSGTSLFSPSCQHCIPHTCCALVSSQPAFRLANVNTYPTRSTVAIFLHDATKLTNEYMLSCNARSAE